MPQCLVFVTATEGTFASPSDVVPCPGVLAFTPAEVATLTANPFLLTPEQGALIASAVVAVWVAAYYWKALAAALNTDGERSP